jgi:ATP/maltotriose-dependent transcriptional regulator MalT/DNA-binding SARP family transcriptional activator
MLAKLSRPRLYDALPRERLFALLDSKRKHPAVWIVGPPGAGKTTLVGSYIQARNATVLWYQVDAGDRDVSSFFHFLTEGAVASTRKGANLPTPSPDVLENLELFSRRYFRALFGRMPGNSLVVLDNLHEAADSALQTVIDLAIAEVPPDRSLVMVSRTDPPPSLSQRLATQEIVVVDWEALRLTLEETKAILSVSTECDPAYVCALQQQTDGWAAGVVLMREGTPRLRGTNTSPVGHSREALFNYFASQIFDCLDHEAQHVLTRTAFLPFVAAPVARELTCNEKAADIVEQLYRRHLFVNHRNDGAYQYHALFRAFLCERAQAVLSSTEQRALLANAGRLLLARGDVEASFELHVKAQEWESARRIVVTHAPELLKQGRWRTLISWLDSLRRDDFEIDPWLTYWRGLGEMSTDALCARATLESAYHRFSEAGNRTGEFHAIARILDTYFLVFNTDSTMDPWIAAAEDLVCDDRPLADEAAIRAYASFLIALLYRQPHHPLLHALAHRVEIGLESENDPTHKLRMVTYIAHYYHLMGDFSKAERLIRISEPLCHNDHVAPLIRAVAWVRRSQVYLTTGEYGQGVKSAEQAVEIAQEHGLADSMVGFFLLCRGMAYLQAGLLNEAEENLREGGSRINPANKMIVVLFYWLEFWLVVRQGDRSRAQGLWEAFSKVPPIGVPFNTAFNHPVACHLADEGRFGELQERLDRWRAALTGMRSDLINFNLDLMDAYGELRAGNEQEALSLLRRAFGIAVIRGYYNTLAWVPSMMSNLCGLALKHGIEPDYVRRLIRVRGLSSPDTTMEEWPWPVRVHALGRFLILKDGEPLVFRGRPQHRTLELLKAMIAFGGREVSVPRVVSALWPEAQGDAAHAAFGVALHRLRKLLGSDHSIRLSDGIMSIDRSFCWVDAMVFEEFADAAHDLEATDLSCVSARLAVLYSGHLFGDDDVSGWALPQREKLRAKYQRVVRAIGERLQQHALWEQAADTYRKATELEPLAEEFYRRVMLCRKEQGRFAEAMDIYRRCRDLLSIVLGVAPSAETQALFRSIQAAAGGVRAADSPL